MSLEVAAEMSVSLLERLPYPEDDLNLLYFLGCLPGGVTKKQLREMWDQGMETYQSLERLQKLPFFETGLNDEFSD